MTALLDEWLSAPPTSPMEAGKARKTLLWQGRFPEGVFTREAYARYRVECGNVSVDRAKGRYVNTETGYFLAIDDITWTLANYTEWLLARASKVTD